MELSSLYFFCIYLDKLLGKLAEVGVGCYIVNIFVGALVYADDILFHSSSQTFI